VNTDDSWINVTWTGFDGHKRLISFSKEDSGIRNLQLDDEDNGFGDDANLLNTDMNKGGIYSWFKRLGVGYVDQGVTPSVAEYWSSGQRLIVHIQGKFHLEAYGKDVGVIGVQFDNYFSFFTNSSIFYKKQVITDVGARVALHFPRSIIAGKERVIDSWIFQKSDVSLGGESGGTFITGDGADPLTGTERSRWYLYGGIYSSAGEGGIGSLHWDTYYYLNIHDLPERELLVDCISHRFSLYPTNAGYQGTVRMGYFVFGNYTELKNYAEKRQKSLPLHVEGYMLFHMNAHWYYPDLAQWLDIAKDAENLGFNGVFLAEPSWKIDGYPKTITEYLDYIDSRNKTNFFVIFGETIATKNQGYMSYALSTKDGRFRRGKSGPWWGGEVNYTSDEIFDIISNASAYDMIFFSPQFHEDWEHQINWTGTFKPLYENGTINHMSVMSSWSDWKSGYQRNRYIALSRWDELLKSGHTIWGMNFGYGLNYTLAFEPTYIRSSSLNWNEIITNLKYGHFWGSRGGVVVKLNVESAQNGDFILANKDISVKLWLNTTYPLDIVRTILNGKLEREIQMNTTSYPIWLNFTIPRSKFNETRNYLRFEVYDCKDGFAFTNPIYIQLISYIEDALAKIYKISDEMESYVDATLVSNELKNDMKFKIVDIRAENEEAMKELVSKTEEMIEDARSYIEDAKEHELDTSKAERLLIKAINEYDFRDYELALRGALNARQIATDLLKTVVPEIEAESSTEIWNRFTNSMEAKFNETFRKLDKFNEFLDKCVKLDEVSLEVAERIKKYNEEVRVWTQKAKERLTESYIETL
jgi:hypothetical protein